MGNKIVKFDKNNDLYHYGVLGMKWGVITKKDTSLLAGIKRAHDNAIKNNNFKYNGELTERYGKRYTEFPYPYKGLLNDKYAYSPGVKDGSFDKYFSKLEAFIKDNRGLGSFDEVNTISGPVSMENQADPELGNDLTEEMKALLLELKEKGLSILTLKDSGLSDTQIKMLMEYSNNCTNCAAVYELRRRGYDVEAMPYAEGITRNHNQTTDYSDNYKSGFKWTVPINSTTETYSTQLTNAILKSFSGNQRGYVHISCHIFNYEVKNNKVNYIDIQSGGLNNPTTIKAINDSSPNDIKFARTDNLELDDSILARVRNRDN